jgi:hypothetical protein
MRWIGDIEAEECSQFICACKKEKEKESFSYVQLLKKNRLPLQFWAKATSGHSYSPWPRGSLTWCGLLQAVKGHFRQWDFCTANQETGFHQLSCISCL